MSKDKGWASLMPNLCHYKILICRDVAIAPSSWLQNLRSNPMIGYSLKVNRFTSTISYRKTDLPFPMYVGKNQESDTKN